MNNLRQTNCYRSVKKSINFHKIFQIRLKLLKNVLKLAKYFNKVNNLYYFSEYKLKFMKKTDSRLRVAMEKDLSRAENVNLD